jgi:hypothetical protein
MNHDNITLTDQEIDLAETIASKRFESLKRFAQRGNVQSAPVALLAPLTRTAYRKLSPEAREAHLLARLREDSLARARERKAALLATRAKTPSPSAPEPETQPQPTESAEPRRTISPTTRVDAAESVYWVPCAGGCGRLVACSTARPSLRVCAPRGSAIAKDRPSDIVLKTRSALSEELKVVALFRSASPSTGKRRRSRRRFRCGFEN